MKSKKRIGILTGGGDVAPLNAVLAAAQSEAFDHGFEIIGFCKGWAGILEKSYVQFTTRHVDFRIGGTILKSSRVNLLCIENGPEIVRKHLSDLKIDGLIVIGGEDTLSNSFYLQDIPQVLISKTIDNDFGVIPEGNTIRPEDIVNYFTLGHPTAARKISSFVSLSEGLRTTAYSHERIIIVESMGMHAGWLAISSSLGHPDYIIIPEFPIQYERFVQMVADRFKKQRNVIIVIAEGARWKDGAYVSADETEKDAFGHPRFKGVASVLANKLKHDLKKDFDTRNVNDVNPSYLYRSGCPTELDLKYATLLGKAAVQHLSRGLQGQVFVTTQWSKNKFEIGLFPLQNLETIELLHRFVDSRFYDPDNMCVTNQARKFLSRFVQELPHPKYGL